MPTRAHSPWMPWPLVKIAVPLCIPLVLMGIHLLIVEMWGRRLADYQRFGQIVDTVLLCSQLAIGLLFSLRLWVLRRALIRSGYRLCARCLYDLSGSLGSERCPECGTPIDWEGLIPMWRWWFEWGSLRREWFP